MKNILFVWTILFVATTTTAQSNIYEVLQESEEHKIFVELLELSGIDQIVKNETFVSVFAPNDEAFQTAFTPGALDSLRQNENRILEKLMLHHITPDTVKYISTQYRPLYGNDILIFIDSSGQPLTGSDGGTDPIAISWPEDPIDKDNGRIVYVTKNIIHLSNQTIEEKGFNIFFFDYLMNQSMLYDTIAESQVPVTVVVPNVDSLRSYLDEIDDWDNIPFIDSLLRPYITDGEYTLQNISDGLTTTAWSGHKLNFTIVDNQHFVNDVKIQSQCVLTNGVLLLAEDLIVPRESNIYQVLEDSEDHKIFIELLELSGLDEIVKDETYYSVFAPNDDAFMVAFTTGALDTLKENENHILEKFIKHHIVADTVELNASNYLPLYGNEINIFITATGEPVVFSANTIGPNIYYDLNGHIDEENGRLIKITDNTLLLPQDSIKETIRSYTMSDIMLNNSNLKDSITQNQDTLTIIIPDQQVLIEYLQANNGIDNTSFLDSFYTRHTMTGFYPLQNIYDGLTTTNWFGDELIFTKVENEIYVNDLKIISHRVLTDGVFLFTESFLPPTEISKIIDAENTEIKIHPNPVYDELEVHLEHPICQLRFYNMAGQIVKTVHTNEKYSRINCQELQAGVYFIECTTGERKQLIRFVKL